MRHDVPPGLLGNLATLRWFALAGQAVTVVLVVHLLRLPLASAPLWAGIGALAAFNLWASHRARRVRQAQPAEVLLHVVADMLVLAWLIAWSGGAMNPFAPLFLIPVALVAPALPARWVLATALLACACYAASAWYGRPLPHVEGLFGSAFDLHLAGMAVMFVISAAVVTFFLMRIGRALRGRERELATLREQSARNEGILALATHAAAVAHELNTPLATLTLMLEDQLARLPAGEERDEAAAMAGLVDACRDRVRELAAPADAAASGGEGVARALDAAVARWRLVRPAVELERSGEVDELPGITLDPGIGHLLQVLLNNAADAGERSGDARVALHVESAGDALVGFVRDRGPGFVRAGGGLFRSGKPGGLGVGLALSHATVERLGGELRMETAPGGGTRVCFRLPLGHATMGGCRAC
ncbi:MAG: sensor histidine kinase [Xanthomonadales bacterium]|nr:sensor histidine kinase [Xanthomonadales bacterium]